MAYDGSFMLEFLEKTHSNQELSDREKHLVGLAVTMTRGCSICTTNRIKKARETGLSEDTLNALTQVVAAVNAGVSARTAASGFEGADAELAAVCTDGTCEVPSGETA